MTKKDYILIAKVLNAVRDSYGKNWSPNLFRALDDVENKFSAVLKQENPKFDVDKFTQACRKE